MKVISPYKKIIPLIIGTLTLLALSSCNLVSFMDKPTGDAQLLEAGRACLDKGDFTGARDYYQALSNSYADIKINESSLATLGENNIFFMADLFESLGSGIGNGNSLLTLAETIAARGKTDSSTRTIIQTIYNNESSIGDSTLKAYSQLISSISMFSSVLASAVGTDGKLSMNSIAANGAGCKALSSAACDDAKCDIGTATGLTATAEAAVTMSSAALWSAAPSLDKLTAAALGTNTAITTLTGSSSSGIFKALKSLSSLSGLPGTQQAIARCQRNIILNVLFP